MNQKTHLRSEISKRVSEVVKRDDVAGDISTVAPVTQAVMDEVVPRMEHLTNNEPWYQSRVVLGALIVVLTRLLAHFGYAIPPEMHGEILTLLIAFGPYAGVVLIGWGRYFATKPLGR